MEIVTSLPTGTSGASGGTKKHVEEWSRLDRLTGMLEHARVEADHWASNTSNSRHHFGQVVDSRARNLADGSVQQQQQTKQLEVFQAHIPGGSVQVIRSHTSTTSSWHNSKVLQNTSKSHVAWPSSVGDKLSHRINKTEVQMDDLKLHHNLVNLNSEKTKANVARFLPNRRPPTRNKLLKANNDGPEEDFFANIPKICYDAHNETEKRLDSISKELKYSLVEDVSDDFENGFFRSKNVAVPAAVVPIEIETISSGSHEKLEKKKSISDENISIIDGKENSDPWKRTSKTRWSFQYPKTKFKNEKVAGGSSEFETSKSELETVLEKVLRRKKENFEKYTNGIHVIDEKKQQHQDQHLELERKDNSSSMSSFTTRKSFVTEETLKQTKQKLRHLNGVHHEGKLTGMVATNGGAVKNDTEEADDGICTESKSNSDKEDEKDESFSCQQPQRAVVSTTGSLESRSKNKSDDWFDRRKSYGFEPVYGQQRNMAASLKGASSPKTTNLSTDSGICRSSELELVSTPIVKRLTEENEERFRRSNAVVDSSSSGKDDNIEKFYHRASIPKSGDINELLKKFETKSESPAVSAGSAPATATVVTFGNVEPKIRILDSRKGKVMEMIKSLRECSENATAFEPNSSMIKTNCFVTEDDVELPTTKKRIGRDFEEMEDDILSKRHSIACEDAKYMISKLTGLERTFQEKLSNSSSSSEPLNTTVVNVNNFEVKDVTSNNSSPSVAIADGVGVGVSSIDLKKPKKVEFSKTEVHFAAAEPGKIKIVETNEKPPPANLYRRKKRSVSLSPKIRLPHTKFGTLERLSYDKEGDNKGNENTNVKIGDLFDSKESAICDEGNIKDLANVPQYTSSTSDNGLAVRISSTMPNDSKRASWSLVDANENKSGYSTKINFGREGVTIIADTKPHKYENFGRTSEANYNNKSSCLDEISEKSHFKPLRNEEEELKTVSGSANIDIKKPKITSVALNVNGGCGIDLWNEGKSFKKCTTVLLNKECQGDEGSESVKCFEEQLKAPVPVVKIHDDISVQVNARKYVDDNNGRKPDDSIKMANRTKPSTKLEDDSMYKAIRVIHHGVRLPEHKAAERRCLVESPKKDLSKVRMTTSTAATSNGKKMISNKDPVMVNTNGSVRIRKVNNNPPVTYRDKLFDSGRDSWLNLPKERRYGDREHPHIKPKFSTNTSGHNHSSKLNATEERERKYRSGDKDSTVRHCKISLGNTSTTKLSYMDASSEDDSTKKITYRQQRNAKPLSTISEKASLKVNAKANANANSTAISTSKLSTGAKVPVTRTTSNSSLESRSNSYEFKNPILKTEERSKRRAARMLQRATSREALLKGANISSSEDITSENEISCLKSSRLKSTRKTKSPKSLRLNQSASTALRSKCNRMIQQKTATMEINIFNIKDKPNDKKVYNYANSRSYRTNNVAVTKAQPHRGQKEINTEAFQKSKSRSASNTINDKKTASTSMQIVHAIR